MASESGGSAGGPGRKKQRSRSTTIDLTATEVRKDPAAPEDSTAARDPLAGDDASLFADSRPDPRPDEGEFRRPDEPSGAPGDDPSVVAEPAGGPAAAGDATRADEAATPDTGAAAAADASPPESGVGAVESPSGGDSDASRSAAAAETDAAPARDLLSVGSPDPDPASAAAASPPPAEPARRGSAMSAAVAALIGGLVVLGGGAALLASGALPLGGTGDADVAELRARLDAVDERMAGAGEDEGLADRVAALEQAGGATPSAAPPDLTDAVAGLESRLAAIEAAPPPAAAAGDSGDAVADLAARVDEVSGRIEEVSGRVASLAPGPDLGPRVEEIAARIGEIESRLADLDAATAQVRAEIAGAAEAADGRAAAIGTLTARLDDVVERLDAGPKGGEIAALSLAVTSLASRVAAGEPFEADLALVRSAAPDVEGIDALAAEAGTGVPTVEELAASFPADAILATRLPQDGAGVVDRLFSGAKSLVNYRETGGDAADPVAAAVSRAEAALAAGDLAAAADAVDGLPPEAAEAAAGWRADLTLRREADAAVAALTDRILDRLQAPAEGQ